jgi:hypothetical protein
MAMLLLGIVAVLPVAADSAIRTMARTSIDVVVSVRVNDASCRVLPTVVPAGRVRIELASRAKRTAVFSLSGRRATVKAGRARAVAWSLDTGAAPYRCQVGSKVVGNGSLTVTAPPPTVTVAVTGAPQTVYDYSTDRCDGVDIPDAPTRVFRDAQGRVQLIASNHMARRMIGPSLDSLVRDCRVVLPSHHDPRPEAFDDDEWLVAPYTLDGQTIHALVHMEYHGQEHGSGHCPSLLNGLCWYDAITLAVSRDGGATYTHAVPPGHVVAAPPWQYQPDHAGLGYMGGSNIVRNPDDGFFYAIVGLALPFGYEGGGLCVIRARTLDDPASWRFWNGSSFAGRFFNPYTDPGRAVGSRCRQAVPLYAFTLSWSTYLGRWLAIGTEGVGIGRAAFSLTTSADLVHWSTPMPFLQTETGDTWECRDGEEKPTAYAAFIDPASPVRNFDVTGKSGWLYYTQFNPPNCADPGTIDRDLVRIPIELGRTG